MDKHLHGITPAPSTKGKLEKTGQSGQLSEAFIVEPKDLVPFQRAWEWQRHWQNKMLEGTCTYPAVWLLQHHDCYTLGRGASEFNLNFSPEKPPSDLFRIDRGGEVTYHLPGQLVVYLVLDLHRYKTDLNWYLRQLELLVKDVLEDLGLNGECIEGLTGVWLNGSKVASIGIGCRRWVTQHGIALNVNCDLKGFSQIVPCGLKNHSVGRLDSYLPGLSVFDVQPLMRRNLAKRFCLKLIEDVSPPDFFGL